MIMKASKNVKLSLTAFISKYGMVIILAVLMYFFSFVSPSFLSALNLKNLILQNTHVLVIVAGLSFIMVGGGIDLSIGYQISLVSVVMGMIFGLGSPPLVAAIAGILTGALCGALNGWFVSVLGVVPFAATLISQIILMGLSHTISRGWTFSHIPATFRVITKGAFLGIQTDIWLALLCMVIVGFVFSYTFYGKHIKAMGENERALKQAGVNVKLTKFLCYVVGGVFYSIAAMIMVSKQGVASSENGLGLELTAIAAVFIGGVTSYRDSGVKADVKIFNLIVGVLILAVIDNGIQLIGGDQYTQYLVIGAILVLAMMLNKPKR